VEKNAKFHSNLPQANQFTAVTVSQLTALDQQQPTLKVHQVLNLNKFGHDAETKGKHKKQKNVLSL
jgi:hypothetical protein